MKKIFAITTLALAATSAFAGITGTVSYDYDRANAGQGVWKSQHEVHTGVALGTKFGTFDGAVTGRQLVTNARDNNVGFEFGYSNGVKLGAVSVTGRAAYGQFTEVDTTVGGFHGNSAYYSVGAEAAMPVAKTVTGFVGYRFRGDANGDTPVQNRYTAGVDMSVNKSVSARVGYAFSKQDGIIYNGVTTAVSYKF
jgi:hypothetical protein